MEDERQLLKKSLRSGSSEDFEPIVSQYINLVYSTALRVLPRQRAQIDDICQTVFADLARKAAVIPETTPLSGWLYRHTCFVAQNHHRSERRRQERERQAAEMNANNDSDEGTDVPNEELHLAMNELADGDRNALVLRFLDERELRGVGERLGISEDAAQKRVSRALDKLRLILQRKGITASAAALTLSLSQQITAAPASFAIKTIAATAVGGALTTGLFPTMVQLIKTPLAKATAIVVIGGGVAGGLNHQHKQIETLRTQNTELTAKASELDALRAEHERLKIATIDPDEIARLRDQAKEVHRLRGEIGAIRRAMAEIRPAPKTAETRQVAEKPAIVPAETTIYLDCRIIGSDKSMDAPGNPIPVNLTEFSGVITEPQRIALIRTLTEAPGIEVMSSPRVITRDREKAKISITQTLKVITDYKPAATGEGLEPVESDIWVGPVANLTPTHDPANGAIRLDIDFELTEFHGYNDSDPNSLPVPIIGKVQMGVAAMIASGQTLLVSGKSKERPNGILLIVTPKVLDAASIAEMNAKVPSPNSHPVAGDPAIRAAPPLSR